MRVIPVLLAVSISLGAQTKLPPAATVKVDFEKDIYPLLSAKCHSCHGEEVQQSGLRLDKRQNALRGGDYGPVIIPGKSADSKLLMAALGDDFRWQIDMQEGLKRMVDWYARTFSGVR